MSTLGKSWSAATAACPKPEHAGSRVRFDGQYGAEGHRRQRYRCIPVNGDRPHRFIEPLPREESWSDACESCEREVGFHEGPHAARVSEWLNTTGRTVEDQFRRRGPRASRPADMPLSTSPLDGFTNPIRAAIGPRAYGLKNRERTNRLLMLMQLHANHQDDVNAYTRHIRQRLEANQGRPSLDRRAVADTGKAASLR